MIFRCCIFLIAVTSVLSGQGFSSDDFAASPEIHWRFTTEHPFVGSPVVSDGIVYAGNLDGVMYALDLGSGAERWTFRVQGPIRSTPCIVGEVIYVNGGDHFYALHKKTGKQLWKFSTLGEKVYTPYGYADYYHSSPKVFLGNIYFGSGDGHVYALDARTGVLKWKYNTGDVVHSSPAFLDSTVYIGSFNGTMYALNALSGAVRWTFKSVGHRYFPKGELQGSPVTGNGLIFVGGRDYNVYAIDAKKGYCHWNKQFPLGWALSLTLRDTALYVGTSDDDVMIAVEARTGAELWRKNVRFNTFGRLAISPSMIYFGTLLGQVYGMNTASGEIVWTFFTDGFKKNNAKYFAHPDTISKDRFYSVVRTPEGYIDGLYSLGAIFSDPVLTNGVVIVSSTDGSLYCLKQKQ